MAVVKKEKVMYKFLLKLNLFLFTSDKCHFLTVFLTIKDK